MLTRRDNFLATLRRQPHDCLPAAFVIDNMNYPAGFPAEVFEVERVWEIEHNVAFQRRLGLDVHFRASPGGLAETAAAQFCREDPAGGTIWATPVGRLHADAPAGPGQPRLVQGNEVLLKRPEDWDTWAWIYEQHRYQVDEATLAECRRHLEVVGDDGILYVGGPATPIMDAVRTWAGIENVVYGLCDFPERVDNLLAVVAERCCEQYELICAHTPATLVVLWDDATTSLLSRALFEKYSLPVLRRYAEIAHRHGKLLVNHTCGKIRGFADLYAAAEQDALDWLAVPPTGDMSLALAQERWQGAVTPLVTPDPATVRHGTPAEVAAHLEGILAGGDLTRAVVLLPCPQGTPRETAAAMVEVLRRYGARVEGDAWG